MFRGAGRKEFCSQLVVVVIGILETKVQLEKAQKVIKSLNFLILLKFLLKSYKAEFDCYGGLQIISRLISIYTL